MTITLELLNLGFSIRLDSLQLSRFVFELFLHLLQNDFTLRQRLEHLRSVDVANFLRCFSRIRHH
ncbi:Uncharacterised protein [Vibrio cholerae]|nr:Uncharacterised protein [Vibrio cholerae]